MFAHVSSGTQGETGNKIRRVSREYTLGQRPVLRYVRRLDLSAAANACTAASFTVLVDDVPVDEVVANGMDYAESTWTERNDIDLSRFAGRTVRLTFEVAASSNVCVEVFAKAWLTRVTVQDVVVAGAA